jgi:hypothetical protein
MIDRFLVDTKNTKPYKSTSIKISILTKRCNYLVQII